MLNINYLKKVHAYISYFLREEINRHVKIKTELEQEKEKLTRIAEERKEKLEDYGEKLKQNLTVIKQKQKSAEISPSSSSSKRLGEIRSELETKICKTGEKISELYDALDEQTEKIDENIYIIDEKIDEINELLEEGGNCGEEIRRTSEEQFSRFICEIEEEIKNIETEMQTPEVLYNPNPNNL
ncbi:MAG: hypothetical protein FWH10_01620 [Oscillospiraceae bacterium]|nr:hypothetical protein [Oscillospiraceae bacterium]